MVIKRAEWPTPPQTAGRLLDAMEAVPPMDDAALERLQLAQDADRPPEDPWRDG